MIDPASNEPVVETVTVVVDVEYPEAPLAGTVVVVDMSAPTAVPLDRSTVAIPEKLCAAAAVDVIVALPIRKLLPDPETPLNTNISIFMPVSVKLVKD